MRATLSSHPTHCSSLALLAAVVAAVLACPAGAQPPPMPPAPPKVIVSDVVVQGNRLHSAEHIKNQMKTRPGREYVPSMVQEDVRTLFATHEFANVWVSTQDAGPRRIQIVVHVRDFASTVLRVTFQGNVSLDSKDLEDVARIRKGTPLNPTANQVACRAIAQHYHEDGRPFASCELLRGGDARDREVVFNIYEGPRVHVRDIRFTGNAFVGAAVLKTHISSTSMLLGLRILGPYNAAAAENDVAELIKYYRSFGFHDARVNRELIYSTDAREVTIVFHIHEGVRYRVAAAPRLVGVTADSVGTLQAVARMKAGDFYDEGKINGDMSRIKDYYGYRGRLVSATATPVYVPGAPGVVGVTYEVKEK